MFDFNLLHISDLHWGAPGRTDVFARMQTSLVDDINRLREQIGGDWDLVLFTGDLVFSGTGFKALDEEYLETFLTTIGDGRRVPLLAVPGNHDLQQPSADEQAMFPVFNEKISRAVFESKDSPQRLTIEAAFQEYQAWFDDRILGQRELHVKKGLLPGDFTATIEKQGRRIGIAGINTAFLHLGSDKRAGDRLVSSFKSQVARRRDLRPET